MAKEKEKVSKPSKKKSEPKNLQSFFIPSLGVSVKAESLEEALKMANNKNNQ